MLYSEFVHDPLDVDNEFDRIVQSFTLAGLIDAKEGSVIVKDINHIEILSRLTKVWRN